MPSLSLSLSLSLFLFLVCFFSFFFFTPWPGACKLFPFVGNNRPGWYRQQVCHAIGRYGEMLFHAFGCTESMKMPFCTWGIFVNSSAEAYYAAKGVGNSLSAKITDFSAFQSFCSYRQKKVKPGLLNIVTSLWFSTSASRKRIVHFFYINNNIIINNNNKPLWYFTFIRCSYQTQCCFFFSNYISYFISNKKLNYLIKK